MQSTFGVEEVGRDAGSRVDRVLGDLEAGVAVADGCKDSALREPAYGLQPAWTFRREGHHDDKGGQAVEELADLLWIRIAEERGVVGAGVQLRQPWSFEVDADELLCR